jgi:hypothetical protein
MIDTLVVGGCSFTAPNPGGGDTWPLLVAKHFDIDRLYNMAIGGAGNYYIKNSVIDAIEKFQTVPENTLVLVMWSGISRVDVRVSQEFYDYLLEKNYNAKMCISQSPDCCYVSSGGMNNSWQEMEELQKLFKHFYLYSDRESLVKSSLDCIRDLTNYLTVNNYRYRFLNFHNFWNPQEPLPADNNFLIGDINKYIPDTSSWIFSDSTSPDGFYEFAKRKNQLGGDSWHPTKVAHKLFVEEIIIPKIKDLFI